MLVNYLKHKSSSKKQYPTVIEELCHQFSLDDLKKSTDNFDKDRLIGYSYHGEVYRGCLKHNGESDYQIAVKVMQQSGKHKESMKNIIELHCQLHHPNLMSLIGFCDENDVKCLVYEYMCNGSLRDRLCSRDMESLSWKKRLEICIGAAKGLHYLHTGAKRPILNRDIKTSTILLDSKMVPKLKLKAFSLQGKFSTLEQKPIEFDVDKICVFKDIVKRCLKYDPNERPAMGEVEVELEHALALQEEEEKLCKKSMQHKMF